MSWSCYKRLAFNETIVYQCCVNCRLPISREKQSQIAKQSVRYHLLDLSSKCKQLSISHEADTMSITKRIQILY